MLLFCFSVHLKIHIPELKHNHKHTKTKYIHIFHPKVVHTDQSSVEFLHSRRDPNVGLINGGYPQPLVNLNGRQPELRITEEEFMKWRQDQLKKAFKEAKRTPQDQENNSEPDEEGDDDIYVGKKYEEDDEGDENHTDDLYKKHKANKANSSSGRKESQHKNHNYNQDFEASNSNRHYANYPSRTSNKRKATRPSKTAYTGKSRVNKNTIRPYGFVSQPSPQASNIELQYQHVDPTVLDPSFYSTLPRDQAMDASDHQDDIYSGLLAKKFNKNTVDRSKLLGDINYNRKTQTKIYASKRKDQ